MRSRDDPVKTSQPPHGGGPPAHIQDRARRIEQAIRELALDMAEILGGERPTILRLRLDLPLVTSSGDDSNGAGLMDAVSGELESIIATRRGVRPGRVRCFQCRSDDCRHAAPPEPRAVFFQYSATGKPVWHEFTEACLLWQTPRVDALFGRPPGLVAVKREAADLTSELILGFGRGERSYRLLGQVALAYLPLAEEGGGGYGSERGGLTLQVVGCREGRTLEFHLNPLGPLLRVGERPGAPARALQRALSDTLGRARSALDALALRMNGAGRKGRFNAELTAGVETILGRLRADLERLHRPQAHKTGHARVRQQEGGRPTESALADAARAPDDRLLFEPRRETVIVMGPKGRVHVFSEDGRHVTSLHHRRATIERKVAREEWVPCEPPRRNRFRQAVLVSYKGESP